MTAQVSQPLPASTFGPSKLDSLRLCPAGITIIIPNWNHELVLPRSISSALEAAKALQVENVAVEIIVVDDHSRDGSLTLLRQCEALWYNEGLRVLALDKNSGPAVARNYGMLYASYRYVIFLDADNRLLSQNIGQFYRAIQDTHAACVYGNLIRIRHPFAETTLLSHTHIQAEIFVNNYVDTFALFDRLQVLELGGYLDDDWLRGLEDWELYLHLATAGRRIVFVPLVFGYYYDLADSLAKDVSRRLQDLQPRLWRRFNQLGLRHSLPLNTQHLRYHPALGYF